MAFQSYTNMLMVSFTCAVSTNMYDDYCIAFGIHRTDDFFFDTREGLPVAHVRLKWKLAGALAGNWMGKLAEAWQENDHFPRHLMKHKYIHDMSAAGTTAG